MENLGKIVNSMKKIKVLFIHHSTGGLLLHQGKIRELLLKEAPQIQLWDHGYNLRKNIFSFLAVRTFHTGLSDQDGKMTGTDYDINLSNNSPKEYDEIFSRSSVDGTLKKILSYDIIAFKNCFPTTKIISDDMLEEHKNYYQNISDNLQKYPEKNFVIFTPPPLRSEATKSTYAKRARELSKWMKEALTHPNVKVFDFFDLLANNENVLKREYCSPLFFDSHPNRRANSEIGLKFVEMLIQSGCNSPMLCVERLSFP